MATADDLWGGQLTAIGLDPVQHTCDLHIAIILDGRSHSYLVAAKGVSELRFRNAIPDPWEYAEVTEAHVDVDERSGEYVVRFLLWSEDAGLVIRCLDVDVKEVPR